LGDFSLDQFEAAISSIYDCAANPDLWPETLTQLRDMLDSAYVMVGHIDMSPMAIGQPARHVYKHSPWDEQRLRDLSGLLPIVPYADKLLDGEIDTAWTQMRHMSEADFHRSDFYHQWVKPQSLRDCANVLLIKRQQTFGLIASPTAANRDLISIAEIDLLERLAPHIRRAIAINEVIDSSALALSLYRKALDAMSVAVFVLSAGRRLAFTNAAGDALLAQSEFVSLKNGVVSANRINGLPAALDEAVERAAHGDHVIGLRGIGVPLVNAQGDRAAAYVLPIAGTDLRGAIGHGHAMVFVARRGEQQPMATEILRTVFDLTQAEARITLLVAAGERPAEISVSTGTTVHTVRSHLSEIFSKTGAPDQVALSALVNQLLPPVLAA
jgi:DNA-binding CsgD family transcriptional regulator